MQNKILVVDDEQVIGDILKKAFSKVGYTALCAQSSEEALDILKHENIKVMFLDLHLPGMNGVELCRLIRKNNPIACIFAMTGYVHMFELLECRQAGFDDYFTKPVNLQVLFAAAKEAFQKLERWKCDDYGLM
jgi:CheY-like chemotaxis protein